MKQNKKPFVTGQEQNTSAKISQTKARKRSDAVTLEAAPFAEDMTHDFSPVPVDGALIVTGRHDEKEVTPFVKQDAVLQRLADLAAKTDCAFQIVENKTGVRLASTLSSLECTLTAAILQEFVTQSRSFASQFDELNKAVKQTRKKGKKKDNELTLAFPEELPLVQIGQNGDDLPLSVVTELFAKYHVTPRELYFDDAFRVYTCQFNESGDLVGFLREDAARFGITTFDEQLTKFECVNAKERVTVKKHEADKILLVNLTDLAQKYLKQNLSGRSFSYFAAAVDGLGKKQVLFMDRNGRPSAAQFFTTFHDAAQYGGKYYALLRLEAPLFDDLQRGRNYLKLSENVEDYLCTKDGVTIRLLCALAVWRNRKKKIVKTACAELFEQFGTVDEVKKSRFLLFWPKLRAALLLLMTKQEVLACKVDGVALTDQTQATTKSKVEIQLNTKLQRRALI